MILPTLYKKSGKKIQQWTITINDLGDGTASTIVEHGQVGGKMQYTQVKYTEGKNLGKTNATDSYQQACSEARSKWNKQKDGGYVEDSNGKLERNIPLPMLAHKYNDYSHQITFPCYVQPKLDGMRCLAVKNNDKVTLWSRKGKPIETMPHIQDVLEKVMNNGEVFDGELYAHGVPFQQQASLFKKFDRDNHTKVSYHVYDMVNEDKTFEERWNEVSSRLETVTYPVQRVPTTFVLEKDHVKKAHDYFVEQGYEGAIIRHGDCKYTPNKRSRQLLKVKQFQDAEFEIVGATENVGKMEGTCTFILKTLDGTSFECTPKGSDSERRQYWQDYLAGKLIGQFMTVRFFEWTDSIPPVPRFPVGISIRNYE